jgi:hypothetical protein
MRAAFVKSGRDTLFDDGIKKVQKGITTIEEVLRVTQVYGQTEDEGFEENVSSFRAEAKPAAKGRPKGRAKSTRGRTPLEEADGSDAKSLVLVLDEDGDQA